MNLESSRPILSAVLVDYDNIYLSLKRKSEVDEAFVDVMDPAATLVPDLPRATIVLRLLWQDLRARWSASRFRHRRGAASAAHRCSARTVARLRAAITIAERALSDTAWLVAARKRLTEGAACLDALLRQAGCEIIGGTPLFRLAAHPSAHCRCGPALHYPSRSSSNRHAMAARP